jgi:tRNA pseudouridine55 synthase
MPFLLIDKPAGKTSHDVVARVRRITGEKRVGHSGTLDPFATGLLIIGVGREHTKHLSTFLGMDKAYIADIALGATTETLDPESPEKIVPKQGEQSISLEELRQALYELTGPQEQTPPMYSAIKVQGKKLYDLARAGKTIEVQPRKVTVYEWKSLFEPNPLDSPTPRTPYSFPLPVTLSFKVTVSSGTYIRALARDLGKLCGTGGYLRYLRRTAIGPHTIEEATPLHELTQENWLDFAKNDLYRGGEQS